MKKNVMMRIASILLVCVLATTCGISGTFAKYVTSDNAQDSARVAKWGVTATVTGEAFAKGYGFEDTVNGEFTLAVESSNEDKLVAPGTSGTFTGVALTGTPEVAVRIEKDAVITIDGWMIDHDNNDETDNIFYCPLVFKINGYTIDGKTFDNASALQNALAEAIEAANGDYKPNTDLANVENMNGNYDWSWDFDGNGADTYDVKDTALGDMVAAGGKASITISVSVTVTQVD